MRIEVNIVEEAGYTSALKGLSFNKKQNKDMRNVALILCSKDNGHNKFLESIYMWVEVNAPRYWWQEADTYRIGNSKQSESTMHTLIKDLEPEELEDALRVRELFEDEVSDTVINEFFDLFNNNKDDLVKIKANLPEGFMQKRMWCLNYKTMRNIIRQRKNHRLPHWKKFIQEILKQSEHAEFFVDIM